MSGKVIAKSSNKKPRSGGILAGLFPKPADTVAETVPSMIDVAGMPTPQEFSSKVIAIMDKANRHGLLLDITVPWGRIYVDGRKIGESGEPEDFPDWMQSGD